MSRQLVTITLLASFAFLLVNAFDPNHGQDFCVAADEPKDAVFVNGKFCKEHTLVTADDFFYDGGLDKSGNTANPLGSEVTSVNVMQLKGLNTLGISLARIDFAPYGLNPPHSHPRATEVLLVLEGNLLVGFVGSNRPDQKNRLFKKVLKAGDVFVFPEGLIHFQQNIYESNSVALVGLSSENPGTITITNALFGCSPDLSPYLLGKACLLDKDTIIYLQSQYWWDNNN
ncbi:germin-like protein subfamily 1 member 17 [Impatiens glandulifera]|uniref:germin-like protein subfamily 1 member 17 n=1 Tax=Impatiens glandulifera TaxID=253017 RepID=UPI001FB0CC2D|nr:germin-like protein subfamily 1 member 17 [Impatiens glandulifera]